MKNFILFLFCLMTLFNQAQSVKLSNSNVLKLDKFEISTVDLSKYNYGPEEIGIKEVKDYLVKHPEWRLPTADELLLIYKNKDKIGNLLYGKYLSYGINKEAKISKPYNWSIEVVGKEKVYSTYFFIDTDSDYLGDVKGESGTYFIRLIKTNLSPISQTNVITETSVSNQKNQKVDYMYCSSGNCDDGFGTMIFPQSTGFKEYTGTWKKGYRDRQWNLIECRTLNCRFDKGKLTYSDGSYYDGSFDPDGNGLYQGYGYLYNTNGTYKKGDFFKGELNGTGEEKKSDGTIYKGQYINGVRQGKGTLTYPNGEVVKGRYWEGKFISEKDDISTAKLDNSVTGSNPTDKKNYSTILINGKEWLTENLNVTTFRNGNQIAQAKTEQELLDANSNQQPVWCYYDFNPATETHYGKLYNWYAVNDARGLLPLGYIIPSVNDWQSLNNFDYFKNTGGRAQLNQSEGKELGTGKINKRYFFVFENGPSKEKKYDNTFGVPESELGFYWTTGVFQDQYNDRINVFAISSNGKTQTDSYQRKGACVSVRVIKGDHNYYVGSWLGNQKSGNGTEYYGVATDLKGYGIVYKGDKYEGLWKNGQQDGEGTIIQSNGSKKTGLWQKGEFIGEWKLVDNRHKCYQCNVNMSKSVKRTDAEISNIKKTTSSNEIGLYNNESYCSSTCELKAATERKAREEQYERERQQQIYQKDGYYYNEVGKFEGGKIYNVEYAGGSKYRVVGYYEGGKIYNVEYAGGSKYRVIGHCEGGKIYNVEYAGGSKYRVIGYCEGGKIYNVEYAGGSKYRVVGYYEGGKIYNVEYAGGSKYRVVGYYEGGDATGAAAAFLLLL